MRRLMKRMAAALVAGACLLSLSACSLQESQPAEYEADISTDGTLVEDAMAQSIVFSAAQTLGGSQEQLIVNRDMSLASGDESGASIYEKQLAVRKEMGDMRSVDLENAQTYLLADGSYTVVIPVTFTEGKMDYLLNLNMATQQISAGFTAEGSSDENTTTAQKTETAVVYTAIGMGTVFAVLIFISLLIYCFKFISPAGRKAEEERKAAAPAAPAPAPAPLQAASDTEEEEIAAVIAAAIAAAQEDEVAAAITAAITAYEGSSSNGLVVRSIRRLPKGSHR